MAPKSTYSQILVSFMRSSTLKPTRPLWLNLVWNGLDRKTLNVIFAMYGARARTSAPLRPNLSPTSFSSLGYAFRLPLRPLSIHSILCRACLYGFGT